MNRPSKVTTLVAASVLIAGTVAGVAAASVHSRPTAFYGCESATGSVSAISTSSHLRCPGATRVRWNATGPRGAVGRPGTAGASGIAGLPGAAGAAGAAGASGPPGAPGVSGERGSLWSTGSGAPSAAGLNGDLYLDTATGNVYELVSGTWTMESNITGPQGPNGVVRDCSLTPYPGIDLAGCNLSLFLPNTNFSEANLSGADMLFDIIDGDNFTNANLTGANLEGVLNGVTPADFTNANLTGANLRNADLRSSNFTNANLSGVDFSFSFGSGATELSTALYNNTTCPDRTVVSSPATCVGHGF